MSKSYEPVYVILKSDEFADMENKIKDWMKKSYKPLSGLCSHKTVLCQAMVKS